MKKLYEAWQDETSITFTEAERIKGLKAQELLSENAKLLHSIEANIWEEAMTAHYNNMGWSAYDTGKAEECPNGCGAIFYPEGSGECPNCGNIC